jgi:NAD(P)-dependent dehydrogenase (short-subunit alcohol dehydrogenase family)
MRLCGAVTLVTGGSSGIGAATARVLARAGARLLIAGRDPARLDAVARDTGALALKADLAEPQGPAELADAALQVAAAEVHAPGIDILINNAGVGWCGPVGEMSGDKIAEILAVNLAAPIELTRRLLPRMTARGAIRSALEHDRQVVYVPRWMSFPARLHGAAPRTFAMLAHWFGDHGLAGLPGRDFARLAAGAPLRPLDCPGGTSPAWPAGCRRGRGPCFIRRNENRSGRLPRTGVRAPCASPARHTRPSAPRVGPAPGAARSVAIAHISSAESYKGQG